MPPLEVGIGQLARRIRTVREGVRRSAAEYAELQEAVRGLPPGGARP
ncbi:hypothetical protein OG389_30865 [Streptomyces sp. NBC_00435]